MPIEIRELNIKVNINQDTVKSNEASMAANKGDEGENNEALIKEAVEEMLRIIDNKKER